MCTNVKWLYKKGFRKEDTFRGREGEFYEVGMYTPCGHCQQCIANKSNNWVVRNYFESQEYKEKCFITLTYDENNNPIILRRKDLTDFIKRLRYYLNKEKIKIRYFAAGEYGTLRQRPHYHIIVYGWKPHDMKYDTISNRKNICYKSDFLTKIWNMGRVVVQNFAQAEIAYISLYETNKEDIRKTLVIKRNLLKNHYAKLRSRAIKKRAKKRQLKRIQQLEKEVEQEKQIYMQVKEFNAWSLAIGWKEFRNQQKENKNYVYQHRIGNATIQTPTPWLKKLANKYEDKGAINEILNREKYLNENETKAEIEAKAYARLNTAKDAIKWKEQKTEYSATDKSLEL